MLVQTWCSCAGHPLVLIRVCLCNSFSQYSRHIPIHLHPYLHSVIFFSALWELLALKKTFVLCLSLSLLPACWRKDSVRSHASKFLRWKCLAEFSASGCSNFWFNVHRGTFIIGTSPLCVPELCQSKSLAPHLADENLSVRTETERPAGQAQCSSAPFRLTPTASLTESPHSSGLTQR